MTRTAKGPLLAGNVTFHYLQEIFLSLAGAAGESSSARALCLKSQLSGHQPKSISV